MGTRSPILSLNSLQEVEGAMIHNASSNNLQELSRTGTMSTNVSADSLQKVSGTMKHTVKTSNLGDLARASSRRKHSALSGNRRELGREGKMALRESTNNLQDLSLKKMGQYKSALNLHDLDLNEEIDAEEDGDDKLLENWVADVMIDVKADQFIEQFHQQMKSQHKRNTHRRQRPCHLAS